MPTLPKRLRLTPRLRAHRVSVPRAAQRMILDLPVVRDHMLAEWREMVVKAANAMIAEGISQNRAARALGICNVTLIMLRRRYASEGFAGMFNKRMGVVPKNLHAARIARIYFTLVR